MVIHCVTSVRKQTTFVGPAKINHYLCQIRVSIKVLQNTKPDLVVRSLAPPAPAQPCTSVQFSIDTWLTIHTYSSHSIHKMNSQNRKQISISTKTQHKYTETCKTSGNQASKQSCLSSRVTSKMIVK